MPPEILYLFTSDQTQRYAQDVLNVLAAPSGDIVRFRYDRRWISDETVERWSSNTLEGVRTLICFSAQHPAEYAPAAFVPIRLARVDRTHVVGKHHFAYLRLEELVSLPAAADAKERAARVRDFTREVQRLTAAPYDKWASLGQPVALATEPRSSYQGGDDIDTYFETLADYLVRVPVFEDAVFLRCLKVREGDRVVPVEYNDERIPEVRLTSGKNSVIELLQYLPTERVADGKFDVSVEGEGLRLESDSRLLISSRYDTMAVRLSTHADRPATARLLIEPAGVTRGPQIVLTFRVVPPDAQRIGVATLAFVGLVLLALPPVFSSPALKVASVVAGGLLAAWMSVFGFSMPRLVTLPKLQGDAGSPPPEPQPNGARP